VPDASRWESRFEAPQLLTVRPAFGDPGMALVVVEESEGAYGVILDDDRGQCSPPLPVPVGYDSLLTNDGQWVVQLADEGGSEVGHLCGFPRSAAAKPST
jgi:hypothetical protein